MDKKILLKDWCKEDVEGTIAVNCVDKSTYDFFINAHDSGMMYEAELKGNTIEKVFMNDYGEFELVDENIELPKINIQENRVFLLEESSDGKHFVGGIKPDNISYPYVKKFNTPFQYIGMIDGEDKPFKWIGVEKLNIFFPAYECLRSVTLDYSNPLSPEVLDYTDHSDAWYFTTGKVGYIESEKTNYTTNELLPKTLDEYESKGKTLLGGVPFWYQGFYGTPRCPKTGKVLKFICELKAYTNKILNSSDVFEKETMRWRAALNIDTLFIFINPENRIVYIERIFD